MKNNNRKQLILVRHADAIDAIDFEGTDYDRPLSPEWKTSMATLIRYLRLIWLHPDHILSSSAVRTRETASVIVDLFCNCNVEFIDDLYFGNNAKKRDGNKSYRKAIRSISETHNSLMLVWHNDEISEFARYLTGDQVPSMKKWSLVVLSLPSDMKWKDIGGPDLSMLYYLTPQFIKLESIN